MSVYRVIDVEGVSISLPPSTGERCRYPTRCGGGGR